MPEARTFRDEERKDGVGRGQPPSPHPGTGPGELGGQPSQHVASSPEVDDDQPHEQRRR